MKIGIIGAGNMGSAFAKRLGAAGHEVSITAQDTSHAEQAASAAAGNVRAVSQGQIAAGAELLILATPYGAAVEALRGAGDTTGKTVIDITNPLTADMSGLSVGFSSSAAEEIQKAVPGARVVKAFNTVFAQVLGADAGSPRAQVLYAGDDEAAKQAVRALIESAGFEAVDAGRSPTRDTWSRWGCSTSTSATWPDAGRRSRRAGTLSTSPEAVTTTMAVTAAGHPCRGAGDPGALKETAALMRAKG